MEAVCSGGRSAETMYTGVWGLARVILMPYILSKLVRIGEKVGVGKLLLKNMILFVLVLSE